MYQQPVMMIDIAQKLKISISAVSKALRNHSDISINTIKMVRTTAEEMGYTPNIIARGLSARKSNIIGVVVPRIAHTFFSDIIEAIYRIAYSNKYEIILMVSHEDAEIEKKQLQTLMAMKVDGIIISITQETRNYEIFERVKKSGTSLVFMDRVPDMNNINRVSVCDETGAFQAVEHAIKLGYRKIGHFAGYDEINIGRLRYAGFEEAMKAYDVPINPDWIVRGGFNDKFGYDAFMNLYLSNNMPDVIFCVTYPVALGIYQAVMELNLKIPDDIDVICFGNAESQKFLNPSLSCVCQPTDLIAQKSMEILLEKINNAEDSFYINEIIPVELVLRETCCEYVKK